MRISTTGIPALADFRLSVVSIPGAAFSRPLGSAGQHHVFISQNARAQWQSFSFKVAGTLRVPSALRFRSPSYGIWKMSATFPAPGSGRGNPQKWDPNAFRLIIRKHDSIAHQKLIRIKQGPCHAGPGGQSFDGRIGFRPRDKLSDFLRSGDKTRQLST